LRRTATLRIRDTTFGAGTKKHIIKQSIIANGRPTDALLPCTVEEFLVTQGLLPRSVVVEHNGEAVAPSEFSRRRLNAGDRLEIVKIVAGG
jgi:sulfur carrier protein